jgi:septum formation inhibitor MinC
VIIMSTKSRLRTARHSVLGLVLAAAVGFSLAGCAEIESVSAEPYEPATLESTGPSQPAKITVTEEAARRVALQTTIVGGRAGELTVKHGALVYDKKGLPWVFAVVAPLTYVRSAVTVKHVEGDLVTLSSGPPAGTEVVTVGAIELWGTELGIAGKH